MEDESGRSQVEVILAAANFWAVLGLPKNSEPDEIKKAYRRQALAVHPDKCSHPSASDAFKALNEAFETLYDPVKKSSYETYVHAGGCGRAPEKSWFERKERDKWYEHHEFSDVFSEIRRAEEDVISEVARRTRESEAHKMRIQYAKEKAEKRRAEENEVRLAEAEETVEDNQNKWRSFMSKRTGGSAPPKRTKR